MIPSWPPHSFLSHYKNEDIHKAKKYLEQVIEVSKNGVPPILTLRHFSRLSHCSYRFLRGIVGRKLNCYSIKHIKKRGSGEKRQICIPCLSLQIVQIFINKYIISKVSPHPCAFAYREGYSVKQCAAQHCQAKWIIKIDIKEFFNSITEKHVYKVFRSLGYGALISFELSRICTYVPQTDDENSYDKYKIQLYNNQEVGYLGQGANSSPGLSNLVMRAFDQSVSDYCNSQNIIYTRYSDDLIFSTSDINFKRSDAINLKKFVNSRLNEFGFSENTSKFTIMSPGSRKLVLGLLVDKENPRLPKAFKRQFSCHLHYLMNDISKHQRRMHFDTRMGMKNHYLGVVSYIRDVDNVFYNKIIMLFNKIQWEIIMEE